MNNEILAPARRKNWTMYRIVARVLNSSVDADMKAETLIELGVSSSRVAALMNGDAR